MLNRQKIIIAMLREGTGSSSHLQLTKWLFLLAQESPLRESSAVYQFVPYKYGPFSFTLFNEMRALVRDGYIASSDEQSWSLTSEGNRVSINLPKATTQYIREVMNLYANLSNGELLETVYRRYPWFTAKAVDQHRRSATIPRAYPAIYTLGYEGLLVEGFLDILLHFGVQRVIDVRSNPSSRRYGFHKITLSGICSSLDLQYAHFPQVGIPSEARRGITHMRNYHDLFRMYERDILTTEEQTIEQIAVMLTDVPSVLVCMEADPSTCHRSKLASALATHIDLPIQHLGWPR